MKPACSFWWQELCSRKIFGKAGVLVRNKRRKKDTFPSAPDGHNPEASILDAIAHFVASIFTSLVGSNGPGRTRQPGEAASRAKRSQPRARRARGQGRGHTGGLRAAGGPRDARASRGRVARVGAGQVCSSSRAA